MLNRTTNRGGSDYENSPRRMSINNKFLNVRVPRIIRIDKRYFSRDVFSVMYKVAKDSVIPLIEIANFLPRIHSSDMLITKAGIKVFGTGGIKGELLLKELGFSYKSGSGKEYMLSILELWDTKDHEKKRRLSYEVGLTILSVLGHADGLKWIESLKEKFEKNKTPHESVYLWRELLGFGEDIEEILYDIPKKNWLELFENLDKTADFINKNDEESFIKFLSKEINETEANKLMEMEKITLKSMMIPPERRIDIEERKHHIVELVNIIESIKTFIYPEITFLTPDTRGARDKLVPESIKKIKKKMPEETLKKLGYSAESETGKKHMLSCIELFLILPETRNTRDYKFLCFKIASNLTENFEDSFLKEWIKNQKGDDDTIWNNLMELGGRMTECKKKRKLSESESLDLFNDLFPPSDKKS